MQRKKLSAKEEIVLECIKELYSNDKGVKVLDLLKFVSEETGMGPSEIMETVTSLEKKGFIKLVDEMKIEENKKEAYRRDFSHNAV